LSSDLPKTSVSVLRSIKTNALPLNNYRPLSRVAVTFPAGVRQFRLAHRIINPAGGGIKLFWRRLAAGGAP